MASGHTPCKSGNGQSACCLSEHYCFDNGLCLDNSEMTTYRGSCTDSTFGSAACAKYCLTFAGGGRSNGVCGVWVCNNNNQFACSPNECQNSTTMFTVSGGILERNQAVNEALNLASSTASTSSSSSTSSSTASSTSVIATVTSTSCPVSGSLQTSCPSHTGALAGLGAALGIPLLIALVALAVLFMQLRKHKRRSTNVAPGASYTDGYNQAGTYGQMQESKNPLISRELASPDGRSPAPAYGNHFAQEMSSTGGHTRSELAGT